MTHTPAPSLENNPDLFDLTAQVLGCEPAYLLKVRQEGDQLVAVLITGQKFTFNPNAISAALLDQVTNALAGLTPPALPPADDPTPAPAAAAPKRKAK